MPAVGHRLTTAEIEHALVQHPDVAEAAVVGVPHDVKGCGIFCFVLFKVSSSFSASNQKSRGCRSKKNVDIAFSVLLLSVMSSRFGHRKIEETKRGKREKDVNL